jgi:hypothetical protein
MVAAVDNAKKVAVARARVLADAALLEEELLSLKRWPVLLPW